MWYILPVVIIVIIALFVKTPKFKGIIGERRVKKILKKCALNFGGVELSDFMIKDERSSSQIDNMLLTQKALYVIEVKNYQGYIFGNEISDEWTVTIKHINSKKTKSGKTYNKVHISKHKFYNPIKQNKTHINKIKNLTGILSVLPVYNIVVFGKRAVIKNVEHSKESYVLHQNELFRFVQEKEKILTYEIDTNVQIDIIDELYSINIIDKKMRREHVKNIKNKYNK
jgi:hypothetical protein